MRASVLLVYVGVSFLWGSTWSVIRVGLSDLPPLLFAGLRMAIAAAILAPLAFRAGAWRGIGAPLGRRIAFVGILQIALPYGLMFVAQQWVPSALAAILFATFPVWIALLAAWLVPGERLGATTLASAALGIAGSSSCRRATSRRSRPPPAWRSGARSSWRRRSSSRSRT